MELFRSAAEGDEGAALVGRQDAGRVLREERRMQGVLLMLVAGACGTACTHSPFLFQTLYGQWGGDL